ncbi:MAG: response regulator [Williamsia sp.]|nr:response regulator [Williamsia sp.]
MLSYWMGTRVYLPIMRVKGFYIVCLCLLLANRLAAAGYPPITYLGIEQGLSNNSVRCIYQDHRGFMWFGTYDGLSRYDGYGFKVFRNRLGDSSSLPHNYIYTICEDHLNNIWVGTGQGIGIYHPLREKFLPAYYMPYRSAKKEKITWNINVIREDGKGTIFIGSNGGGLMVQYSGTETAVQLPFQKENQLTPDYNVTDILIDVRQQVWLFVQDVGLCQFDYAGKKIRLVNNTVKVANCLAEDSQHNLWIGTSNGLYAYNPVTAGFFAQYTEQQGRLTDNNIWSLSFDRQHRLWIGTYGGGINILDPATGSRQTILPGQGSQALTSESVFAIYHDGEDRKWIGTLKGGINIINPRRSGFQTIAYDPLNRNSLVNNFASCFWEDSDKNLWIGTDGGGLSIWNRTQNLFRNFVHEGGNSHSLSNNLVTSILEDHEKKFWVSTFGGGINRYNPATASFDHYPCINGVTGEENKNGWLLYEDSRKKLWATTFSRGRLYFFNRSANRFEVFDQVLTDLIAFTEDSHGTLWAGNSYQLIKIDPLQGRHQFYEIGKPVRAIKEDSQGNFWLGTEGGGLVLFNRQKGQIAARYSDRDGLCNNSVLNIEEEGKGILWLSTFNGLSQYTPGKGFKNFYQSDGLQSNQFLYNAAARLQSGELVFGGIKGFTLFYPDSLRPVEKAPAVYITGLRINNKAVSPDDPYVTQVSSDQIETLKIPYNEAVLSFDWAALEYSTPDKISYAYYLEHWDKGWNSAQGGRTASYTYLKEGNYLLHIKATNPRGAWKETTVSITVLPPWYRTGWAYVFYLFAAGTLISLYLRYRTQQTKLYYEIRLARLTAEKEKELNEKKLAFFTDISHEFRTPITLIINPLKDMLQQADKKPDPGALNLVYRNASRLLKLVDQLLQFQKVGTGKDQLKISRLDVSLLCRDVYESFVKLAASKQIDYQFSCTNKDLELYADREKIEIVLFNLLSNAMKFTQAGGQVVFGVEERDAKVEIKIADNGPGIPAGVGDRLFERFYRVSENRSSPPGFGIGLYLVKHFVDRHAGTIRYQSEPGKGTTFFVSMPKGKAHLGDQVIYPEERATDFIEPEPVAEQEVLPSTVPENPVVSLSKRGEPDELVSGKATVLVVEDNPEIRLYVKSIFSENYSVYEGENGQKGLELAHEQLPDIIISDVMMPNGSGIELCRAVKQDPSLSHIPVILLTALSASDMQLQGLECGADDYITKPFEKDLLVARVANLLKNRTSLQHYFYNEITLQQNTQKISAEYKEFLEKCIAIVEAHLDNEQFGIKNLAREIGMSHSNLYKRVKSISGQSVNAFIRFIRLRKAAELMINTNKNVNEAAFEVGIKDSKYFREQFNKLFGMNPSEYIKKYRKAFGSSYRVNKEAFKNYPTG